MGHLVVHANDHSRHHNHHHHHCAAPSNKDLMPKSIHTRVAPPPPRDPHRPTKQISTPDNSGRRQVQLNERQSGKRHHHKSKPPTGRQPEELIAGGNVHHGGPIAANALSTTLPISSYHAFPATALSQGQSARTRQLARNASTK